MLTKDDNWINSNGMRGDFKGIISALPNKQLRELVNNYFDSLLPKDPTAEDRKNAVEKVISKYPEVLNGYMKIKENDGAKGAKNALEKLRDLEKRFIAIIARCVEIVEASNFYEDILAANGNTRKMCEVLMKTFGNGGDAPKLLKQNLSGTEKELALFMFILMKAGYDKYDGSIEFKTNANPKLQQRLETLKKSSPKTHVAFFVFAQSRSSLDFEKALKKSGFPKDRFHIIYL